MIKAFHDFLLGNPDDTCQVIDVRLMHLEDEEGKTPRTKRSLRVKSKGRNPKGKTTLRMGSKNIRAQAGPSCYSHAVSTALRGIISWRKKKNEDIFEKLPEHIDLQQTINSIYAAGTENKLVNVPILKENLSQMGIVTKTYANVESVILDLLNHEKNGIHITISISADERDYYSLPRNASYNNIVYYPGGDILPSFKKIDINDPERQAGYILPQKKGHRMFVSGIGVDFKGKYFLEIKNSWGSGWGDGGKIKLSIDFFKKLGTIGSFNLGNNVKPMNIVLATPIPSLRKATFRFEGYVPSTDHRSASEKMGLGGRRKSRRKKKKRKTRKRRKIHQKKRQKIRTRRRNKKGGLSGGPRRRTPSTTPEEQAEEQAEELQAQQLWEEEEKKNIEDSASIKIQKHFRGKMAKEKALIETNGYWNKEIGPSSEYGVPTIKKPCMSGCPKHALGSQYWSTSKCINFEGGVQNCYWNTKGGTKKRRKNNKKEKKKKRR